MSPQAALQRAIKIVGDQTALAKSLGVSPQAVCQWDQVPPRRVLKIEELCQGKITRHDLRPDIYGIM